MTLSCARHGCAMSDAANDLDPTTVASLAIIADPELLADYVFEIIGPADARTTSDGEAAERIRRFTHELALGHGLRRRAPALAALALLDLLDDIDWLVLARRLTAAVRPRSSGQHPTND
jgi:hypothetical protein